MRTIAPFRTAERIGERVHEKRKQAVSHMKKRISGAVQYLESKHEFELVFCDKDGGSTGEKRIMTGHEAKVTNALLRAEFIKAVKDAMDRGVVNEERYRRWRNTQDPSIQIEEGPPVGEFYHLSFAKIIIYLRNSGPEERMRAYWLTRVAFKCSIYVAKAWVESVKLNHKDGETTVSHWP